MLYGVHDFMFLVELVSKLDIVNFMLNCYYFSYNLKHTYSWTCFFCDEFLKCTEHSKDFLNNDLH